MMPSSIILSPTARCVATWRRQGYVDTALVVVNRYFDEFFPRAAAVASELRKARPAPPRPRRPHVHNMRMRTRSQAPTTPRVALSTTAHAMTL